tara:strand:+ start:2721 stop:3386 length:666 start_codon:yes stop_codon:yes gene_type:complete
MNEWSATRFASDQPQTPFAPTWDYTIAEKQIDLDLDSLADIVLKKEIEIKEQFPGTSDGNTGLGSESLTSRFRHFNVLSWGFPATDQLHKEIKKFHRQYYQSLFGILEKPPKLRIRCWANVLRKGEQIQRHWHCSHPYTYLGGHFTVTAGNTCTVYVNPMDDIGQVYQAENVPGKLTLFPNYIPHYTSIHQEDFPRITIAFDLTTLDKRFIYDDDNTLINL